MMSVNLEEPEDPEYMCRNIWQLYQKCSQLSLLGREIGSQHFHDISDVFKGPPAGAFWAVLKASRAALTAEEALAGFHGEKKGSDVGQCGSGGLRTRNKHKHQISLMFTHNSNTWACIELGYLYVHGWMPHDISLSAVAKKPQQSSDGLWCITAAVYSSIFLSLSSVGHVVGYSPPPPVWLLLLT